MLITKAINNNVVLAEDDAGRELVLFGKGLGFRGAPSYIEDESSIQRSFRDISPEMYDAVASLSDDVIIIASGIVDIARNELNCTLNPNLVFTLADHLQFAIDRARKGASIKNPLYEEVRLVYPREAEVGRAASSSLWLWPRTLIFLRPRPLRLRCISSTPRWSMTRTRAQRATWTWS